MKVAFRTDASLEIGTGHVMRCLTLADFLREQGGECFFVCRPHAGHLLDQITRRGYRTLKLPLLPSTAVTQSPTGPAHGHWLGTGWVRDAEETRNALGEDCVDWLVVDHYALDRRWEQALRPACRRLMVMDDLADRPHDCDLLLDPTLGRDAAEYAELLPDKAATLLGPQFALLRPEFAQLRAESLARRAAPQLRHLLVTMGGVDKDNATGRVLDALNACVLPPDLRVTAVSGAHSPWIEQVRAQAAWMRVPTRLLVGVNDMARLMTDSDLAIGAAGGTSWERCCLGLPTLQFVLADNQSDIAKRLIEAQAAHPLDIEAAVEQFSDFLAVGAAIEPLALMSRAASRVTDGQGAQRVVSEIMGRL